jgi:hypothetical protein
MTNPNLTTDTQILDNLHAMQNSAKVAFESSLTSVPETLGASVRDSHGAVCTASFAAVRNALADRKTAVTKAKDESARLAKTLPIANATYTDADSKAGDDLNNQML